MGVVLKTLASGLYYQSCGGTGAWMFPKQKKNLAQMKKTGLLKRVGPDKGGHWEVVGD